MNACLKSTSLCLLLVVGGLEAADKSASATHSSTPVRIQQDASADGWEIRLKFSDSDQTARAAETWTLEEAQRILEELKSDASLDDTLDIAEFVIVGKDGDGKLDDQAAPKLPDWQLLQKAAEARAPQKSSELNAALSKIGKTYSEASRAVEDASRLRRRLTDQEVTQLTAVTDRYNASLSSLEANFFNGLPSLLPRFTPVKPEFPESTAKWAAAREAQFMQERLATELHTRAKSLNEERTAILDDRKRLIVDDHAGVNPKALEANKSAVDARTDKFKQLAAELGQQQSLLEAAKRETSTDLSLFLKQAIHGGTTLSADQFAGAGGKASFTSQPGVKVLKTDSTGNPLPDDQQPQGYPRMLPPGAKPAPDEKPYVDPAVTVKAKSDINEVRAGVYGKVLKVDPESRSVDVAVTENGSRIRYQGIDPAGIKAGDFIEPQRPIGRWRAESGARQDLQIIGINPAGRYVNPFSMLQMAAQRPARPNTLARSGRSQPDADELPTKEKASDSPPKDGENYEKGARLTFDDNAPPAKYSGSSPTQLDIKEAVAKRELERLQRDVDQATDKLSQANQKKTELGSSLKQAESDLANVKTQGETLLTTVKDYAAKRKQLADEQVAMDNEKKQLDAEKERVEKSKDEKAIEAYNQKAEAYNRKQSALEAKKDDLKRLDPTEKLAALQRSQKKAQSDKTRFEGLRTSTESAVQTAKTALSQAKNTLEAKQKEITQLAAERQQLKAKSESAADDSRKSK